MENSEIGNQALNGDDNQNHTESDMETPEENLGELSRDDLLKKLEELRASSEKNHDLYLRAMADIENLKRRFRKEKEDLGRFANESIIRELLPVLDNLQNAISFAQRANASASMLEGISLTLKMLIEVLKKSGVKEIKAVEEAFDPNFHQAVMHEETEEKKAGIVIKELQKGYLLNERLIRPSMVVVGKGVS
ncbi:MAG: nucleotide exchange factor GrpE [Deltaproteobacteria bacterium CG_4_8_14_3_um_filter_51_11]|nr:nucleotide exchange factor GrpE [bacterium]OIP41094.1 MAG: nucleotide exchange factor GrpE [Desulfobacteraceae bacterium CG2_30_51_40]PIP45177.1 MAG: nucleotide exchange factor GrpE [Deltaproteobacteria bacterium CG23_combo_of_CG06-09_8_20_14_all_51_20]PIX20470.1 MAG: nucleotide exchange factor GrpE [Deltaproteobacteria bacterium CG_4_8_14_3_um_filter_51_11]PJB36885.1 MAG: nucleotide exchange factor GrpE [Deltaproteobacteria bacterium CG_4_9_14_3_um_filter_51_14]